LFGTRKVKGTALKEKRFREFCTEMNLDAEVVRAHVKVVKEFEAFLRKKKKNRNVSNATAADIQSFVSRLTNRSENSWENLLGLLRYSRFAGNRKVEVALLELLDGSDVLENLSATLKGALGESKRNEIFEGISLPPLGTHSKDKPRITKKLMENLETRLGEKKSREILSSGPHAAPKEEYLPEKEEFLASNSLDDFLEKRRKEYVELLEKHMKEKTLYYTQEIDEEVLDYVRDTPTCQVGVREGDVIYVTKIPYMAKRYLHEKDSKKKRYYYCHCPWVRESILSDLKISPNFCYCSAGFEKRVWDVIFDQPVQADVVETVLKGDPICKFAIHIPKEYTGSGHAQG
jgi:hypothetical protein